VAVQVALGGLILSLVLGPSASAKESITATWSAGERELTVIGDAANDAVTITCTGGVIKVNGVDPTGGPAPCSAAVRFSISVGDGDDSVDVEAVTKGDFALDAVVRGGSGNDTITGSAFSDLITGGPGHDSISAGVGFDGLVGGEGDDILNGGSDGAEVSEKADVDFVLTNTTLSGVGSDTLIGITSLLLGGGPSDNVIDASAFSGRGRVFLTGYGGYDVLLGSPSGNSIDGGPGRDRIVGRGAEDGLFGGPGADRIDGGGRDDVISGGNGRDTLRGGGGHDELSGNGGADLLGGGPGRDRLSGQKGIDRLHGGPGKDEKLQ
jgi:Ca2+-binding RTX toxin-like protein